ncbi:MAG TPA: SCO family protein [Streptosporangiaceae bacterium]|nr:SCO family protein [Streptosporangiaceae bacterium]
MPDPQDKANLPPRRRGAAFCAVAIGLPIVIVAALIATFAVMSSVRTAKTNKADSVPASDTRQLREAARNPNVDPGSRLPGTAAPSFTLTDQFGAKVSLSQFRGKVVVLAFLDSRCTTICPLTTVSMTQAVRMLGPAAARHVQLLGINANPDATAVSDVRAYSAAHQMPPSWHFLTGSKSQLAPVWRAYHVYVAASHGEIDHQPALYVIDTRGRERTLYLTQMAYAGVGQQADLIASGVSKLLPGHPAPHDLVPLKLATAIKPTSPAHLPVVGGARQARTIALGPGHPHLVVFIASWVSETSRLPAALRELASYQSQARRHGWPSVVAVDESQTESNVNALPRVLANAGGARLGYPVVADTSGRVSDGYGVLDIPWIALTSSTGRILFSHDGWLSLAALTKAVAAHRAR